MRYRPEIDGLRAVAVLPVILFHAGVQIFSGGFVGVDIFFVISGFLITSIIAAELSEGRFSILKFYERRARRILPALFLVMATTLPLAWLWLMPQEMQDFSQSLVAVSTFTSNLLFWQTSGYFAPATELKPMLHTWSLAVEEQFYVLFPLLLMLIWRWGMRWVVALLFIAALGSLAAAEWTAHAKPIASFYLLPTRAWELLVGAFVALYMAKPRTAATTPNLAHQFGSAVGLLLIAGAVFWFDKQTPFPGLYALPPTLGAALIILFAGPQTTVGRLLASKPFVSVGLISYSAYLWHQPLLALGKYKMGSLPDQRILVMLAAASLALAWLSWKYVEAPFRSPKTFTRKQIFGFSLAGNALFIGLGVWGNLAEGYPSRFLRMDALYAHRGEPLQRLEECFLLTANASTLNVENCAQRKGRPGNILLLGDSHAASVYPGLAEYLDQHHQALGMITASYCLPLLEHFPPNRSVTATPRCEAINQKIMGLIKSHHFDLIVVSTYMSEWGFKEDKGANYPGYYQDFLAKIKTLNASTPVLMVGHLPVWTTSLPQLVLRESVDHAYSSLADIPDHSPLGVQKGLFTVDQQLKADLGAMGIPYVSLVDRLCPQGACQRFVPTEQGRRLMSFDYGHLGLESSAYVAQQIIGPGVLQALQQHGKRTDGQQHASAGAQ
jgi:peptidoglycan/LPS O-acetylase OafA/YrhL